MNHALQNLREENEILKDALREVIERRNFFASKIVNGEKVIQIQAVDAIEVVGSLNIDTVVKDLIIKALTVTDHNQVKAAKMLGLTRSRLRHRMQTLGLESKYIFDNQ